MTQTGSSMKNVLQKLQEGEISIEEAEKLLKTMQIAELEDFAKLDISREVRTGVPEAIFAERKEDLELIQIIRKSADQGRVIVTRLDEERFLSIKENISHMTDQGFRIEYNSKARVLVIKDHETEKKGKIGIITAGT